MNRFRSLFVAGALMITAISNAEPTVDITVVDGGSGSLEVRFRPDGSFNGVFSSLVFTLRWNDASGATLGAPTQTLPVIQYIGTSASGGEVVSGGYRYQPFAGFGFMPLSSYGVNWTAGQEIVLMTIPVTGGSALFEIVNDSWTAGNNGDFYVSLNGAQHTGSIYTTGNGFPTITGKAPVLTVIPNPTDGAAEVWLNLDQPGAADISVLNTAGQVVWKKHFEQAATLHERIALKEFGTGTYMVQVEAAGKVYNEQVVVR